MGLISSRFLGSRFLCSFLSCWFLGSLLCSWLLSSFLGSWFLSRLLGSWLLSRLLLNNFLRFWKFEGSLDLNKFVGLQHFSDGKLDPHLDLLFIPDLVVCHNILEDSNS